MKTLIRGGRDLALSAAFSWKETINNDGVALSLSGMSHRMRSIMLRGTYEREDARLCLAHVPKTARVLELGSAVGFIALYCLNVIGVDKYAMVEANPELAASIKRNFAINSTPLAPLVQAAAGSEDGTAEFNVHKDFWSSSLMARDGNSTKVKVATHTIPTIIEKIGFEPDTLIMDIEGGEQGIPVEHMARFDRIIAELHPHIIGQDKVDAIITGLAGHGLKVVSQEDKTFVFVRS